MSKRRGQPRMLRVLGAMSGTSLGGVDAAVLGTDGTRIAGFGPAARRPYTAAERETLRAALGLWPGDDPARLSAAEEVLRTAHAELLSGFEGIDLVGFHGQTLAHEPRGRGSFQAGNGADLAGILGLPVVWDFRAADLRLGGEGAPLTPFYHHALARHLGMKRPVAFLNLGGLGTLSWVDPSRPTPETPGAVLAFDTGPATAPLDDLMLVRRGLRCDEDGALAAEGRVAEGALELFLDDPYFSRLPPKSLDRNGFATMVGLVGELSDADAAATLTAMSASAVMRGMEHLPEPPDRLLVSGGGRLNPVLMEMLSVALDCPVEPVEEVGLDGDRLDAQAVAFLAARVFHGLATSCAGTTGVSMAVGGGEISRPTLRALT
ncbi:anhydro-N-acetylmuramic acid kinase [Oceanicola sp. S124]|uniref:anhydro-N-acetylmuramic acid kinase n=1 Tax=Oceanicola sp. S124 TaxID=1042378 RepID=UPI0002557931|nr:anhydro-N-acetylmuramic acid kinase [Oceanicola sp. S124]